MTYLVISIAKLEDLTAVAFKGELKGEIEEEEEEGGSCEGEWLIDDSDAVYIVCGVGCVVWCGGRGGEKR